MDPAKGTAPSGDAASPGAERDRGTDERGRDADGRDRGADERDRAVLAAKTVRERAAQAVEHAEAALDANGDRVRRAQARLDRALVSASRTRAAAARPRSAGKGAAVTGQPDFPGLADRVSTLRRRTAEAAARLAETEERAARIFDEMAARDPGNRELDRLANDARSAMRRAREIERRYSSP